MKKNKFAKSTMEEIFVTKNGKTFIGYSKEQYEENATKIEAAGYRLLNKEELTKLMEKKGYEMVKSETEEKPKSETDDKEQITETNS